MLLAIRALLSVLLVAAAVIDARERRFPNQLALAMALAALAHAALLGAERGLLHLAIALIAALALTAFELLWRRWRGSAGIGMGDIKLLFALVLADPVRGLAAYALGLVLLAIGCVAARRGSLPLIPFIAVAWLALALGGV